MTGPTTSSSLRLTSETASNALVARRVQLPPDIEGSGSNELPTNVWDFRRPSFTPARAPSTKQRPSSSGKSSQITTRPPSANPRTSTKRASAQNSFLDLPSASSSAESLPAAEASSPTEHRLVAGSSQGTTHSKSGSPSRCVSSLTLSSPTALLSSAPEWQAQFFKTKLCPFFVRDIPDARVAGQVAESCGYTVGNARGVCVNRESCRFAHACDELRPLPDLRKTKLCSSYTKRVACKNAKCPFAHSPQELRTSSSVFYKVTLCNFYKNGRCWNGANCRFAHGSDELRGATAPAAPQTRSRPVSARPRCEDGLLPTPATKLTRGLTPQPPPELVEDPEMLRQLIAELGCAANEWDNDPWPSDQCGPPPGFANLKVDTTEALLSLLLPPADVPAPSAFSQSTSPTSPAVDESIQQVLEALTATTSLLPPDEQAAELDPTQIDDLCLLLQLMGS